MDLKRWRQRFMSKAPIFYCISICFFSVCALFGTLGTRSSCLDNRSSSGRRADYYNQEFHKGSMNPDGYSLGPRRFLSGPGSSPPRCTSKCGRCTPCKPVHVPVPPGTPVTQEYYPEAWRCKCGNKLFMP
ncbi:EPIDERMAL PATTERNING FACTOR-like protein 4 [Magnolia sinica]|uniref:EPIDERMAL PATTERNING FACTOR-like protein 4 n=1 Tax=Magnolia sinica TaxID=86752 RepID=UPI00265B27B4|nr:EPIDERMAL PATTERNING FACTOR-like protein 4 [Magnolia sinica]